MKNMGYREMLSSRLSRMLGWNVTLIFVFTGHNSQPQLNSSCVEDVIACPTADRFFHPPILLQHVCQQN